MKSRSFGSVTVGKVKTVGDLKYLLEEMPKHDTYLIKPNWYSPHPSNYTDCRVIEMVFEALEGDILVIEGYSLDRQDGTMSFNVDGEEVDWGWLMEHPDWSWIKEEDRWDIIREQDDWFLKEHGFSELFSRYGVEYINVTEEIWSEKVVDPMVVKREVEARFPPTAFERIYGFMPKTLYEYRGSPLISLGKMKGAGTDLPSLSIKNIFGLVPDPLRSWWHGPENRRLTQSIIDITKIYSTFFELHGICEAINGITVADPEGDIDMPWGRYRLIRKTCFAAYGQDLVELDAVLCALMGINPKVVQYINGAKDILGEYNQITVTEAKNQANSWLKFD